MGLRLFFLPNFPGATFIQGATIIPDSRVVWILHIFLQKPWLNKKGQGPNVCWEVRPFQTFLISCLLQKRIHKWCFPTTSGPSYFDRALIDYVIFMRLWTVVSSIWKQKREAIWAAQVLFVYFFFQICLNLLSPATLVITCTKMFIRGTSQNP